MHLKVCVICIPFAKVNGFKGLVVDDLKQTRESHVKVNDNLRINIYNASCKVVGCTVGGVFIFCMFDRRG